MRDVFERIGVSIVLNNDVDGDGAFSPLTDGILLVRHVAGVTGDKLVSGALKLELLDFIGIHPNKLSSVLVRCCSPKTLYVFESPIHKFVKGISIQNANLILGHFHCITPAAAKRLVCSLTKTLKSS